jgi:hypothetical protein
MMTYGVSRDSSAATDSACGEFSVEDEDLTVDCVHKRRRQPFSRCVTCVLPTPKTQRRTARLFPV